LRRGRLQALLARFDCPAIRASEAFTDGIKLLRAAERMKLEGVVSKRLGTAYSSGDCRDWVKVRPPHGGRPTESDGGGSSGLSIRRRWWQPAQEFVHLYRRPFP
jgi:ATP-dependent DNA ligase